MSSQNLSSLGFILRSSLGFLLFLLLPAAMAYGKKLTFISLTLFQLVLLSALFYFSWEYVAAAHFAIFFVAFFWLITPQLRPV